MIEGTLISRSLRLFLKTAVVCQLLLSVFGVQAQTSEARALLTQDSRKLEFEVASVKPTPPDRTRLARLRGEQVRVGARTHGDMAEYLDMSLRQLIAEAYQVNRFQVVGPDWLQAERFDVLAKIPAGTRRQDAPVMLQSLLADRFKLLVHREFREQAVSALVVAKDGPKLTESDPEPAPDAAGAARKPPDGAGQSAAKKKGAGGDITVGTVGVRFTLDYANSSVHVEGTRMTMAELADVLMRAEAGNGRAVVDMTGLKGNYDVVLDIPFSAVGIVVPARGADAIGAGPADLAADPGSGRMLRSLKSLGLELVNRKAPVEQVIVDHMEKAPIEN